MTVYSTCYGMTLAQMRGAVVSVLLMSLFHTMPVMTCFIYCAPVTS